MRLGILSLLLSIQFAFASSSESSLIAKELLPFYRQLHSNPELSLKEEKTGMLLAKALEKEGLTVTYPFAGTGVVGILKNGKGKTVLLRTDLDALPITEQTGLSFASKVKTSSKNGNEVGVMHACGHDIHMTNLLGAVRNLTKNKNRWQGTLVVIGQPAEEIGEGALNLLAAGLLKKFPRPDYAIAFHVHSLLPAGKIGYVSGPAMAAADSVSITVKGKGGHGAIPQESIDPVVIASKLVLDLQTVISRERDPLEPSVISVGSFHCGTKSNIIPDSCRLDLTVRSFTKLERDRIMEAIKRKAEAQSLSAGAPKPIIEISQEGTTATVNNPQLVSQLVEVLQKSMGKEAVEPFPPSMASEDFSHYGEQGIPAVMFFLGSINESRMKKLKSQRQLPSLHSPFYYPDAEETLRTGIEAMTAIVEGLLPPNGI